VQKPRISCTVADAAEIAPEVPTSPDCAACCADPLGKRTSTTPSQNAIRNKKNIRPVSPAAWVAARPRNLAGSIESRVRSTGTFLSIIDENTPQIFAQLEKI
jgi:hypothetical protein